MSGSFFRTFKLIKSEFFVKANDVISKSFSKKYLFYTNVGVSFTLSAAGDIIEQHYEIYTGQIDKWNANRTRNMSVYGMTIGAFCHHWYFVLDRFLPGRTLRIVVQKIVIDQVVCSPICVSTLFLTSGLLNRQSKEEVWKEVRSKAWTLYTAEWVVWPPAQFINFYLLPTRFRVVYDSMISLGYDIYTSQIKHGDIEEL